MDCGRYDRLLSSNAFLYCRGRKPKCHVLRSHTAWVLDISEVLHFSRFGRPKECRSLRPSCFPVAGVGKQACWARIAVGWGGVSLKALYWGCKGPLKQWPISLGPDFLFQPLLKSLHLAGRAIVGAILEIQDGIPCFINTYSLILNSFLLKLLTVSSVHHRMMILNKVLYVFNTYLLKTWNFLSTGYFGYVPEQNRQRS